MKVGILTFSASHNCGSMLQAFALQYVIAKKLNYECELINYANDVSRNMYGLFDHRLGRGSIKRNINTLLHLKTFKESAREYQGFSDKYLALSDGDYRTKEDLAKIASQYDVIIAGGDQVWNVCCADAGKEFYLNFTHNVKKVAYSPSLGGTNILKKADNLEEYRQFLKEFSSLSVREPHGKMWLEELSGREVKIVADSTLLLSPEEWCKALPVPEIPGKYIFNYAFYYDRPETNRIIQRISQETGMPVYTIDLKSHAIHHLDRCGIKRYDYTGPLAFLGLMKNASLVLTQSFHGTLFSSLFNRNFWSYNWVGMHNPDDDRATAILEQMGLMDRYQMIDDLKNNKNIMAPIDFNPVNKRIEDMRAYAMDYLVDSLK